MTKDSERAADFFLKACDNGSAPSCVILGAMYKQGRDVPEKDEARAAKLFTKACDGGDVAGCLQLGVLFEQGRGVAKDQSRAMTLYTKACDGGDAPGRVEKEACAVNALTKACDGGYTTTCFHLGVLVEAGHGVSLDKARAMSLFKKACHQGDDRGCVKIYPDACDGGDAPSCSRLGLLLDEGYGVGKDRTRVTDLYAKACTGGDDTGCTLLKIKTHYTAILKGLAKKNLAPCRRPAHADTVRLTVSRLRELAQVPALPDLDLNVMWDRTEMLSQPFIDFANAPGESRVNYARALLSAPATLVVDVESYVPPQLIEYNVPVTRFTSGSLTVRQVQFDPSARPICHTRVTIKNTDRRLSYEGETWFSAATGELGAMISRSFDGTVAPLQ